MVSLCCAHQMEKVQELQRNKIQGNFMCMMNSQVTMVRAIEPLSMSLEKIKIKVKSVTANKSSEILNSSAAKILTQMQSVESQVQSEVFREKLKSFSKQKRKFLEREFGVGKRTDAPAEALDRAVFRRRRAFLSTFTSKTIAHQENVAKVRSFLEVLRQVVYKYTLSNSVLAIRQTQSLGYAIVLG